MRLPQHLIETFTGFVAQQQPVALVTVVSTSGSTYSKTGSQMLVGADGSVHGLLSGGCLENDLAERAANAIETGQTDRVEYDLRGDDDVFGLGVGCEGAMQIEIRPLLAADNYEPFSGWLTAIEKDGYVDTSFARLERPCAVLILGAGHDAEPLVGFCQSLGWRVTVSDHRSGYVGRMQQQHKGDIRCVPVGELAGKVDLGRFDAAIVMSHHLASDRQYLRTLADSSIDFVGLLGPPHRRDRLLEEIGEARQKLTRRLRSPVGKRIGGLGPAAIALEVVAELQEYFCELKSD